jgi:uncharacterized membrane protein
MASGDWLILICMGGGFIVLGLIGILWGRYEEKKYFEAIAERRDVREFMSHWPERPQPGALRVGGWISIVLGVLLLVVGLILWLTG